MLRSSSSVGPTIMKAVETIHSQTLNKCNFQSSTHARGVSFIQSTRDWTSGPGGKTLTWTFLYPKQNAITKASVGNEYGMFD